MIKLGGSEDIVIVRKDDLLNKFKGKNINFITLASFKNESFPLHVFKTAHTVLFIGDDSQAKFLKNKFGKKGNVE